jgi:hypothetical protein
MVVGERVQVYLGISRDNDLWVGDGSFVKMRFGPSEVRKRRMFSIAYARRVDASKHQKSPKSMTSYITNFTEQAREIQSSYKNKCHFR